MYTSSPLVERPSFSLDNLGGAFIPYDCGLNICPGRNFAKQEIMLSFAMLYTRFDIELCIIRKVKINADMRYYGHGTPPPKGMVSF